MHRISADETKRIQTMESTLGYLMSVHTRIKQTKNRLFLTTKKFRDGNPNGGSGKSLLLTALGQFKKLVTIDGKSFDANKSDFRLSTC